jgi:predicted lipoprotein
MSTRLLLLLLAALTACTPKPKTSTFETALTNTAHNLIMPWHEDFARRSAELHKSLEQFCQNPADVGALEISRTNWREAMLAWQTLQLVNFGPVTEGNQAWRIQFWPDTHNRVGQKIDALLAAQTPIDVTTLADSNVLVQGLSALEYVLFDPSRSSAEQFADPRTCLFLTSAAANTRAVAGQLLQDWSPEGSNYLNTFLSPGPTNLAFPEQKDVLAALVSALVMSIETLKNKELGEPFGGRPGAGRINPYHLELWRSGLSLTAMQVELAASEQVFLTGVQPLLADKGHKELARKIEAAFADSRQKVSPLPSPLFTHLREPETLPQLQAAWDSLNQLLPLLKRELPATLQLQLGFNASDGD